MNRKIIIFILCITLVFSISAIAIVACTCTTGLTYTLIDDNKVHIPYCKEHDHYFAPESHSFSQKTDSVYHWQECSLCKYKLDVEPHDFNFMSLTSTAHYKACSDCGYSDTENHNSELQSDSTGHWQGCADCGYQITGTTTHTLEQESTSVFHWQTCEECGYSTSKEAHIFKWQSDNFYHWKECTGCGYTTAQELHTIDGNGGCTVCSRSNEIMKITPPEDIIPVAK